MVSLTTDSLQRNATVITIAWPTVSESVLRVRLGVTVFCILEIKSYDDIDGTLNDFE